MEFWEIQNALSNYCRLIDDQDVEKLGQIFTEDAQLVIAGLGIDVTGRDLVRETYRRMISPKVRGLHCLINPVIEIEGEHANVELDNLWFDLSGAPKVGAAGRYHCRLVKSRAGWLIEKLTVTARNI